MSRDRIIHVALPSRHVYDIRIGSGALFRALVDGA